MTAARKARVPLIAGVEKTTRAVYRFGTRCFLTRIGAEMAAASHRVAAKLDGQGVSKDEFNALKLAAFRALRQESANG